MKFLFVGLGGIGQRHLRNLRALLGNAAEVHAYRVCRRTHTLTDQLEVEPNTNLEEKYQVRVHNDLTEALALEPDAVFICNPSSLHISVAIQAASAGCHLFIEKPLSHNFDGVSELIRLVRDRGRVGFVGYQLRFHPCLQRLKEIASEGTLGRILAAHLEVGEYLPAWHKYEDYRQMYASRADLGGGVILSQIHEFDYLYWLFGLPQRVFCIGGHYSHLEVDVEDVASASMEFSVDGKPTPVCLHLDYVQRPPARKATIVGDSGKVLLDLRAPSLCRYDEAGELAEELSLSGFPRNQLFLDEMSHFLACLRGEEDPLVTLTDGLQSLRMALAARESMKTGEVVQLQP